LFSLLGSVVGREVQRRMRATGIAWILGMLLFALPLTALYSTSLGGFYKAEADGTTLRLRYLLPVIRSEIPLGEVIAIEPTPWYRGRWRLQIVARSGERYESATWHQDVISASALQLQQLLGEGKPR
jgi:hypothetical protein